MAVLWKIKQNKTCFAMLGNCESCARHKPSSPSPCCSMANPRPTRCTTQMALLEKLYKQKVGSKATRSCLPSKPWDSTTRYARQPRNSTQTTFSWPSWTTSTCSHGGTGSEAPSTQSQPTSSALREYRHTWANLKSGVQQAVQLHPAWLS